MGCWNGTCAISNLHITAGQDVMVLLLLKNDKESGDGFCYSNALYDVCPVPFYGKYDDYGGVEDPEGFGLNLVVKAMRQQLYEFGEGPNEYHDCEVKRATFDIDKLFEADHEGRLGIQEARNWNGDAYDKQKLEKMRDEEGGLNESQQFELDRLANKIRNVDTFSQVTHVQIHAGVVAGILKDWYIEDYVGDGKGNKGHGNNYVHLYFKDLEGSVEEYVRRLKEAHYKVKEELASLSEKSKKDFVAFNRILRSVKNETFGWDDPCMAAKWMNYLKSDSSSTWDLIDVPSIIDELSEQEKWDSITSIAKEVLKVMWLNSFMSHTRKLWTKQSGAGSQNSEPLGYQVLANTVLDVLKKEKEEYSRYIGDDEDFNPDQLELEFDEE
jgi:hypothetical protein